MALNLNEAQPSTDMDGEKYEVVQDYSLSTGDVSVYFRDIEAKAVKHILAAPCVFGAVAWRTSPKILAALSNVHAAILVQKEDFLRPDSYASKDSLRSMYSKIKSGLYRWQLPDRYSALSQRGDPEIHGVRCVGNHNRERRIASPRMHNKFLVFCRKEEESYECGEYLYVPKPYAVWTGSFNMSYNATNSLENAVYIENPELAMAYLMEWCQIYSISEDLNWDSEYRYGS